MTQPQQPRSLADLIAAHQVQAPPDQLDQEGKEALADSGEPFTIDAIQYGDSGDFGPYFEVHATLRDHEITFRLASNPNRDPFMASMAKAAAAGPISNCRLRALHTKGGNKFIVIEPTP